MVAVVTGASVGLGRAIAARLRQEGRSVVITGRRQDVLTETADAIGARGIVCDHADTDSIAAFAAQIDEPVELLVNNAGGNREIGVDPQTLLEIRAAWLANYDLNVVSAVLTTTALDDRLASGGAVVNLGSIAGSRGRGSYGAAKAALVSWAIDVGRVLGKRDITVNTIAPGFIDETDFFDGTMTDGRRDELAAETMNGRVGVPDDIAGVVAFLGSSAARHITGQTVHVNGGALAVV